VVWDVAIAGDEVSAVKIDVKTICLYSSVMTLFNVRLSEDDAAKVRSLRREGVGFSQLVREALRSRYDSRKRQRKPSDVQRILDSIHARYPDPPDKQPRGFDLRDRKAVKKYLQEKIRRGKRR
jgi:hypothetical protein